MSGAFDLFDRLLPRWLEPKPRFVDLGRVGGAVYAVGDVHGCLPLLTSALAAIGADAAALGASATIILLGDVVDRGPDSAGVLRLLGDLAPAAGVRCVLGNHERMFLSFLDDPVRGYGWLGEGGYETLLSYGLSLPPRRDVTRRRLRQMVQAHIPQAHIDWLRALPHAITLEIDAGQGCEGLGREGLGREGLGGAGQFVFCHAGLDPRRPLMRQTEAALLWGRGGAAAFAGLCTVQGHVIVDRPDPEAQRIMVDTGAFRTGILSVLRLAAGQPPVVMSFGRDML